jgi:hypothetical protein
VKAGGKSLTALREFRLQGDMTIPYKIDSLAQFIGDIVQYCPNYLWTFRGQPKGWPLLPKAYRDAFYLPGATSRNDDLIRFERWCHQAIAFELNFPGTYLEQLALAQHYGLATRLMDWTANAAIALFFATEHPFEKNEIARDGDEEIENGAVYLYRKPRERVALLKNVKAGNDLRKFPSVLFYRPRLVNRRMLAQDGEFTIHSNGHPMRAEAFTEEAAKNAVEGTVLRMCVPGGKKADLQRELRAIGIQARTAFPDLEGLAKSTNWQTNWVVRHPSIGGKKT